MLKKLLSVCLALVCLFLLSACAAPPPADNGGNTGSTGNGPTSPHVVKSGTVEGCTIAWAIYSNGFFKLTGEGELKEIQSAVAGNDDRAWAEYIDDITSVEVGEGITGLSPYTFKGCARLIDVVLPRSLTALPSAVFENCTSLRTVRGGTSVTFIGDNAFANCRVLMSVSVSPVLREIEIGAFHNAAQNGLTLNVTGNQSDWQTARTAMTVASGNDVFENATLHYFPIS